MQPSVQIPSEFSTHVITSVVATRDISVKFIVLSHLFFKIYLRISFLLFFFSVNDADIGSDVFLKYVYLSSISHVSDNKLIVFTVLFRKLN